MSELTSFTQAEIDQLRTECATDPTAAGYSGMSDAEFVTILLERPVVPNPEPAPKLLKPFGAPDILGLLTRSEKATLFSRDESNLAPIGDRIREQDRDGLALWGEILKEKGAISQATYDNIVARLSETEDDPSHPATVLGENRASVVLGRTVGSMSQYEIDQIRS